MPDTPTSIFISYSRSNSDFVDRLEADLQARNFHTWVDRVKLEGGQDWLDKIQEIIEKYSLLLLVLSPEAIASNYVKMEYRYAIRQGKLVIPLEYKATKVPMDLNGIQWVNFKESYEQGLKDLLIALNRTETLVATAARSPSTHDREVKSTARGKKFDVFLSHNSHDKPWVIRLKDALQSRGLKVWLDRDEIRPGNLFVSALESGLESSKAVALIVSPESLASGWVKEEYHRALSLAHDKYLQLIPVILHKAELPGFLANRSWIDFSDESAFNESLERLIWGITGKWPGDPGIPPVHKNQTASRRRNEGLEELEAYRKTVRVIYDDVFEVDWQQDYNVIKNDIASVDKMLRDTIKNVGRLDRMAIGGKIKLIDIIENLSSALRELNLARDKAEGKNVQTDSPAIENQYKYDRVLECRKYLKLAENMMVFSRRTIDRR